MATDFNGIPAFNQNGFMPNIEMGQGEPDIKMMKLSTQVRETLRDDQENI